MIKRIQKNLIVFGVCVLILLCLPTLAMAQEPQGGTNNNETIGDANSSVNGDGIIAISIGAEVINGDNNVAIGFSNQIINSGEATAVNNGSFSVQGTNSTSELRVGYGAVSGYGDNNTAIGSNAQAGGLSEEYRSDNNVAIGNNAIAVGGNSVALGSYSIANEANTVSVGQPGYERRIMNLAPGYYNTDAVNMSQLRKVDSKVDRVGSMAFAMSALVPLPYDPKDPTQYSAGIGSYNGQGAVALGVFHYSKPTVMYNAAIAMSDDGWEKSARLGVTWRTGGAKPKVITPAVADKNEQEEGNIVSRVNKILADNQP